jgi:hypothetical protein
MKLLEALPKDAREIREWKGRCDFHQLRVCTCKSVVTKEPTKCEAKCYMELDFDFHALLYQIECTESHTGKPI